MPDRTTETTPGERRRRFELLARERAGDKTVLWRVGAWAGVAIASAVVAAVVANSPTGARHGALLAANSLIAEQHKQIQQFATINEREARRLANAVETLNSDRNRLFKRVTDLEHNLDTVTGSVSRFTAAPPAAVQIVPPPANVSAPATQPAAEPAKAEPAKPEAAKPEASKPVEPAKIESAKAESTKPEPTKAELAKSAPAAPSAAKAETTGSVAAARPEAKADAKLEPRPDTKAVASASADVPKIEVIRVEPAKPEPMKAETAKPDAAKTEPAKVEATKADVPKLDAAKLDITKPEPAKPDASKSETPKPDATKVESSKADDETTGTVNQTQFGIDLGHASSIEGLRAIWAVTRKTHGALVGGLQPLISVREQNNGMGMQLRLVVGPMTDAAAAAILCAKIADDDRPCRTAVYDGQRLALRGDTGLQPETATPPRASKPAKSAKPERKPRAEAKSSSRFSFPGIFAQP